MNYKEFMKWQRIDDYLRLDAPALVRWDGKEVKGTFEIYVERRPRYCDRGDWKILVEGHFNDVDEQDGFPRYFFGSEDEVKLQVERFVLKRKAYQDAIRGFGKD